MSRCDFYSSGAVDLYFYRELNPFEHDRFERHLPECVDCRRALEDLKTIRAALAGRPEIAAPHGGDWTAFMVRLDHAVRSSDGLRTSRTLRNGVVVSATRSYAGYLAMAALIALVTVSVFFAWRAHDRSDDVRAGGAAPSGTAAMPASTPAVAPAAESPSVDAAFATLSEQHFERSKLVVLGLANKDPGAADWEYERELAGTLLSDTRLYRLAAEERGLSSIARVMQDLELVLLQASMSDKRDASSLEQLQRLIRKRDLVTKIELVTTTAGI